MSIISLTIDGLDIEVQEGTTVLQAARKAGLSIPTICDHKDLSPYGACRMCVVEIEGVRGFPTSCTTPVTPGMQVTTQSEQLSTLRNCTLELMFSGHPNSCLKCPHRELCEEERPQATKAARTTRCGFCANRDECELREMALDSGLNELDLPTIYSAHKLERDDPFMDRDYNLCVLCGRCWRICEKIHGKPAINIIHRGKWARIGTAFDKSHLDSGCVFCGACVDICPTGTLTDRFARWQGKPDQSVATTCQLCPQGCSVQAQSKDGQLQAYTMPGFDKEDRLCLLGRFGAAQILSSSKRITRPLVREGDDLIPVDWDYAYQTISQGLLDANGTTVFLISETTSREERYLYARLASSVQGLLLSCTTEAGPDDPKIQELAASIEQGKVKAVVTNGFFISKEILNKTAFSLVIDCMESELLETAQAVLPAAVLCETQGSYRSADGTVKQLRQCSQAPGDARPEWQIVCSLAQSLGKEGFEFDVLDAVTRLVDNDAPPAALEKDPRENSREIVTRFRGHYVADIVPSLAAFDVPVTLANDAGDGRKKGFALLEKQEIVPNMHFLTIEAPQVARFAQPGQFAILMARETSERSPFTLVDWDKEQGTISLVIEEVGRSSRELASLRAGEHIAHVSGPLGLPMTIENTGTVFLGGGCYGIGAIYPLARAFKEAGNRVICAIEAASSYLLYRQDELAEVCDHLLVGTKDGSLGIHGGIAEIVSAISKQEQIDQCVIIGCTFMMRMVTKLTKSLNIPTQVALNPIMVDGTGMCGACRVSIDNQTQFACVDGPIFDGHSVDWDELALRRSAYRRQEVQALPQTVDLNALMHSHSGGCGCGRKND
ncbi:sulfide/dihydroorotate dehydrogenase-like FAD/NAD-binding protein [Desulfogranum japonicum]|uniref:sulfide/dihydroorotate dehydrogenase-like FAD/NAD-binding protein n=1 Tax=Desulfogranum japonicum TaxID=231447 RepID=UPI0003FBCDF2|nr:sulfide/dihydroorotate dehydrogenase-like FAD/NAD-binding protein [Desulfogranum japonicum]